MWLAGLFSSVTKLLVTEAVQLQHRKKDDDTDDDSVIMSTVDVFPLQTRQDKQSVVYRKVHTFTRYLSL